MALVFGWPLSSIMSLRRAERIGDEYARGRPKSAARAQQLYDAFQNEGRGPRDALSLRDRVTDLEKSSDSQRDLLNEVRRDLSRVSDIVSKIVDPGHLEDQKRGLADLRDEGGAIRRRMRELEEENWKLLAAEKALREHVDEGRKRADGDIGTLRGDLDNLASSLRGEIERLRAEHSSALGARIAKVDYEVSYNNLQANVNALQDEIQVIHATLGTSLNEVHSKHDAHALENSDRECRLKAAQGQLRAELEVSFQARLEGLESKLVSRAESHERRCAELTRLNDPDEFGKRLIGLERGQMQQQQQILGLVRR